MGKKSPQVDAYIAKAAPFAQPILERVRAVFHKADPDIAEAMKWSAPFFEHEGIVGQMAAFKNHVRWGLWKAALIDGAPAMGEGKISDVSELPPEKEMIRLIKQAVQLNLAGEKVQRPSKTPQPLPDAPDDLLAALRKQKGALANFEKFPPSHKREYIDWIVDAKQEATRAKRIAQAAEWIAEGKSRNWKYERKK